MPSNTVSVEVLIEVEYEDTSLTAAQLASNLQKNLEAANGRGLLTDGIDGAVETQGINARGLSQEERDLDEKDLANWLSGQIEDGNMKLEDIPRLMARYAFSAPAAMRQEFAERMGL